MKTLYTAKKEISLSDILNATDHKEPVESVLRESVREIKKDIAQEHSIDESKITDYEVASQIYYDADYRKWYVKVFVKYNPIEETPMADKAPLFKVYNTVDVKLRNHMGGDDTIVAAARASVDDWTEDIDMSAMSNIGLINYLMREKHGSPFEHNSMTFFVKAPIFVFREIHRHRMASYNEMSGRYTELPGDFYIPSEDRHLVNVGTSAKPEMAAGDAHQYLIMRDAHLKAYEVCWEQYHRMLDAGICNEVSRDVLPVGLFSQMVMTLNLRSAFNFLSLRTHVETAQHVSRPQREIEMVAEAIEEQIQVLFPVAYEAFNKHGRVAP